MKTIKYSIILLASVALLGSCKKKEDNHSGNTTESKAQPVFVEVKTIDTGNYSKFFSTSGKVEAVNSANISTRMMGYVEKIHVKVGQRVIKGQLLLSINSSDLAAQRAQVSSKITEANSALESAERDFNRVTALYKKQSVSEKELDDATTYYNMTKARLAQVQNRKGEVDAQFSYTNIRAPFSGVVTNKFINLGSMANPGVPLMSIESEGQFQVMTRVSESEIANIKLNSEVEVTVKAIEKTVKGKVLEISASGINTAGQYEVKILLSSEPINVFSGMFASVAFPKSEDIEESLVLIDRSALITRGQLTGLYTVSQSNTALLRWIRVGRSYGSKVEVLSGLTFGESYIVSSKGKLFNGASITNK